MSARKTMPAQKLATCARCDGHVPYFGRRDLLELIARSADELEAAFQGSSGRVADVTLCVAGNLRIAAAHGRGLCRTCAVPRAQQLTLTGG